MPEDGCACGRYCKQPGQGECFAAHFGRTLVFCEVWRWDDVEVFV